MLSIKKIAIALKKSSPTPLNKRTCEKDFMPGLLGNTNI